MGISPLVAMKFAAVVVAIAAICCVVYAQEVAELNDNGSRSYPDSMCGIKKDGCTDGFWRNKGKCICQTCTECVEGNFEIHACGGSQDVRCKKCTECGSKQWMSRKC